MSIVYVLTNSVMPNLVKIGRTDQQDANVRIGQLYTTGVPVPFKLEFAGQVPNSETVETALHIAFGPYRINPRREFFRIDPEQAIAILKLLHVEDATAEIASQDSPVDEQSLAAAEQQRSRRPTLNFEEMGIPAGSELRSIHSDAIATVIDARRILFDGEETSLSAATRLAAGTDYPLNPGRHWTYNGRSLRDIYDETYGGN